MNDRINKLYNLERYLIDNIHLDTINIQNKIVNLKSFIFRLKAKKIKDEKIINKVDENIKEIENMMKNLGIDFEEKMKNNEYYSNRIKEILHKLFYYKDNEFSKYTYYARLDLIGVNENIKYLINYIIALDQSIFDEKDTAEKMIKYIENEATKIDIAIKKLELV